MAVFYDTGGGDIYGGLTKEAVIEAMRQDLGDDLVEDAIEEVSGSRKIQTTDENEEPLEELITLDEEYGNDTRAYCIASDNC